MNNESEKKNSTERHSLIKNWYFISKKKLSDPNFHDWAGFLPSLIENLNSHIDRHLVHDIAIRSLERVSEFSDSFILDHILDELGLFPYIKKTECTTKEKIRLSLFTTPHDNEKKFHIRQAEVFHRIMNGENVVLSAPTSFGKSLIIEALVSSDEFNNIVIIVPTIALIDELKRKLFKYRNSYKIITQTSQFPSDRNIFIFTQERVIEYNNFCAIDFFIIDEFYKLAPTNSNDERCDKLNIAFRYLYKQCDRFYMLGPRINGLAAGVTKELRCTFLRFDSYTTVATNEFFYPITTHSRKDEIIDKERDEKLFQILSDIGREQQTVIYCKSPKRASSLMARIMRSNLLPYSNDNDDFSKWLSDNFHPDWSLAEGVRSGIAYHHAQLPRAIGSHIVDLFNESKINILICTSTLIEGVNTNAKNIIIYDDCITRKTKLDMFTFNNISGRSGRMFEHFVGNVYIFGEKPQLTLPLIDIPIITQSEQASDSLLLHLGPDVNDENKSKIRKYYEQEILPVSLLLKHQGIDPNRLIKFAESLMQNCGAWNKKMVWDGIHPTGIQLKHLSTLMFDYFNISAMASGAVRSASQLNKKLIDIIQTVDDKKLIASEYDYWKKEHGYTVDDAIQSVFRFKKNIVSYNLPRIIYAINDIQSLVFKRFEYNYGDYTAFAASLENFYLPPAINSLEEFGIPTQIAKKMTDNIAISDLENFDNVLSSLSKLSEPSLSCLTKFEREFIDKALSYM